MNYKSTGKFENLYYLTFMSKNLVKMDEIKLLIKKNKDFVLN